MELGEKGKDRRAKVGGSRGRGSRDRRRKELTVALWMS